jgi:DNA-binding response OmpR family regulator
MLSKPARPPERSTSSQPAAPAAAPEPEPANAEPPARAWRILIVEDDARTATLIRETLELEEQMQWEMHIARSGEEALKLLAAQPVDLLLLDVRLPGISGAEVYHRLRAAPETRALPIIFLSGGTTFDLYREGIQEGILLRKPFNISELLAMVRANLPAKPTGG